VGPARGARGRPKTKVKKEEDECPIKVRAMVTRGFARGFTNCT